MNQKKPRVLTSDGLRNFVASGGRLSFKPRVDDDGKLVWDMFGLYPDGEEKPVFEGRTGEVRVARTTRGVVGYWRMYHPEDLVVPVPILPEGAGKL